MASDFKVDVAAGNYSILRARAALVRGGADAQSAVFSRIYRPAKSGPVFGKSLSPSRAYLVLPADDGAGAVSLDGLRDCGLRASRAPVAGSGRTGGRSPPRGWR